ncbi:hypothetical protein B7939_13055 [Eggerthia catenaformis]|nr:hypothetical protein B7939_13055 [Eggerthia catenaformis]
MGRPYTQQGVAQHVKRPKLGVDNRFVIAGRMAEDFEIVSVVPEQTVFTGQPDKALTIFLQGNHVANRSTARQFYLFEEIFLGFGIQG